MNNTTGKAYTPIIGALLGIIAALSIYGWEILNPSYIDWLMSGDSATAFLGWHFFRAEPWSFPLGAISSYQYPQGTSLVYLDALPLPAILLKIADPILPSVFQYQGLWLYLSYALQGYFATLLLNKFTHKRVIIFLGSIFFILSPVMVQRVLLRHNALGSHWLIIASLCFYFRIFNIKTKTLWILLLAAAVMINFYLYLMILVIFMAYLLKQLLINAQDNYVATIIFLFTAIIISVSLMALAGYFVIPTSDAGTGKWGYYSMNILAPINPRGRDVFFLNKLPSATKGQYEGFNYWGFGLIILVATSIVMSLKKKVFVIHRKHFPLILAAFILSALAISTKVTILSTVIFDIDAPFIIKKVLSFTRSSGRMFWPVTYMVTLSAITLIIKSNKPKISLLILLLCVALQIIDLFPWYKNVNLITRQWSSPLTSSRWPQVLTHIDHITFVPPQRDGDDYIPFAFMGANSRKTLNVANISRFNIAEAQKYNKELLTEFRQGTLKKGNLYVVKDKNNFPNKVPPGFISTIIDGYQLVYAPTNQ